MEFHQLRYVCAIADTGSFSRAAERCQIAQPSSTAWAAVCASPKPVAPFCPTPAPF